MVDRERYYWERDGLRWAVRAGTGTRALFRCWREHADLRRIGVGPSYDDISDKKPTVRRDSDRRANMKRAYIRWHIRRYGHEPQWGNGETIEQYRGWCAGWRAQQRSGDDHA